jgi:hypothetical protein
MILSFITSGAPTQLRLPQMAQRRSNCAFTATITVLSDMRTAPTAGDSKMPWPANTPAASGIAATL